MNTWLARYKWWLVLAVLLAINLVAYAPWKRKGGTNARPGLPPGMEAGNPPEPPAEMRARMEERLSRMTAEERAAFEARRKADREFFDSVKGLSESERREKVREYMARNPPPMPPPGGGPPPQRRTASDSGTGSDGGSEGGSPGGGPGGDGKVRVPPPDQRRGMDSQIVNSQKAGGS